mgnify:CR=1 FL=1
MPFKVPLFARFEYLTPPVRAPDACDVTARHPGGVGVTELDRDRFVTFVERCYVRRAIPSVDGAHDVTAESCQTPVSQYAPPPAGAGEPLPEPSTTRAPRGEAGEDLRVGPAGQPQPEPDSSPRRH